MPALPISEKVIVDMIERLSEIAPGVDYWSEPSMVADQILDITQYMSRGARLSAEDLEAVGLTSDAAFTAKGLTPGQEVHWLDVGPVLGVGLDDGVFHAGRHSVREGRPEYERYDYELRLLVIGYVKATPAIGATPAVPARRLVMRLWQDHLRALLSTSWNLGGLVHDFRPDSVVYGAAEPYAEFGQTWTAITRPIAA